MATYGKSHTNKSVVFDGIIQVSFDNLATLAASSTVAMVSTIPLPMAQDFKVEHVAVTATAISGSPAYQIVVGTGAAGSPGTTDTAAIAGTTVFAAPISVSVAAGVSQTNYPSNMDVIYPASRPNSGVVAYPLTLRVVSGAGDTASNLKVTLAGKCIDPSPYATMLPSPDGTTGLDPSDF
jgi:hypothetical protein